MEGTPVPEAPPSAPRPPSDQQHEVRALESVLQDALNNVTGRGDPNFFSRFAAHLIENVNEERRERARPYSDPEAIWSRVASGDVVLIRASWLLHRAGFRQIGDRGNEGSNYLWAPREPPRPLPRRQDIEREFPDAIMPLEELRAQHRNFKEVAQEAMNTAAGRPEDTTAHADGAEAMPVITISHCWERADHPDPHGETLRIVAAELADGGWDAFDERGFPVGAPTCGMPLLRAWGMEDVGVFWDWTSLHQAPRTADEARCFQRAFADMSLYFAHSQITSYLVQGQQAARLATARDLRGWPYFEEAVSTLLKPSPPRGVYELPRWPFIRSEHAVASSSYLAPAEDPDLLCPLWGKVVRVTREDGGPIYQCKPLARTHKPAASVPGPPMEPTGGGDDDDDSLLLLEYGGGGSPLGPSPGKLVTREERSALAKRRLLVEHRRRGEAERLALKRVKEEALEVVRTSRAKPPPLAPSAFATVLREKAFADGTDCAAISGLYREVMEDGFGGLEDLHLSDCGWDDGDVRTLARSLREVRVSEVRMLDLSHNHLWTDGEALAEAFEAFHSSLLFRRVPLCTLRVLRLRGCKSLVGLPASLVRLHRLERLDLSGCEALRALPEQIGAVGSLLHIDCSECFSLGCLPESCGTLHALRYLNLDHCDSLTVLPDLSMLPKLEIDNLPDRLAMWHKCGRKGFDFMQTGPDPETTRHLNLSFLGTERLPAWLGALGNVCELNLTGCESLTSLAPVSRLARLSLLKLGGCRSLVTLRDACLSGLAFLRRLELFHCTGLLELPDLSKKVDLAVIGLPTHMEPWEEEGRLAFVFDPTAPPRPKKRGGGEKRGGAQAGAGGGERSKDQGLGQGQDEAEPQQQKQVAEVNAEKDPAEAEAAPSEAAPLPADQSLELAFLDWGDPEVSQLAEALAAGSTICGRRFDPERVTELNLSDNTSVRSSRPLGRVLCQLPRLATLRLSGCAQLSELPDEVGDCATLHTLDLQGCMSLRELPDALCGLGSTLAEIHLHRSGLRSLPQGFHRLTALRVLHISGRASSPCPIEELPASVCELTNLVEVSLVEFGHLLAVPDELFALPRLRVLTLGGFRAVTAPLSAAIGRAQALEHLSLQSWPSVVCLPEELGNCAELQSLTIGCQGVTTLPESIGRLQRLENLELKDASAGVYMGLDPVLSSLPASFSQLAALKELALRGSFVRLPEVVGALPTLRRLNLAGSESMTSLCDSLPPTLEALSLSQCSALRSLPEAFSSLVCLQEANFLGCVELASLPDVSALTELTRLDLRLCFALQSLPSGLMDLHGCCVYLPVDEGVVEERTLIVGQQ